MQEQAAAAAISASEALEAAVGATMDSADQMDEDDDEEIDDEIDPDDEEEELAMQQPTVHDVHVSTEPAAPGGVSGRERVPSPSRCVKQHVFLFCTQNCHFIILMASADTKSAFVCLILCIA